MQYPTDYRKKPIEIGFIILSYYLIITASAQDIMNSLAWTFPTQGGIWADPVIHEDTLYIASTDGNLYAINRTSGLLAWNFQAKKPIYAPPMAVDNGVFFGSDNGIFYALNKTGSEIWNYGTGGGIRSSPVLSEGILYFGSKDTYVYALNSTTGRLVWKTKTSAPINKRPLVLADALFIPDAYNNLYALNKTTGAMLWQHSFQRAAKYMAALGDELYVSCDNSMLFVLEVYNGTWLREYPTNGNVGSDIILKPDSIIYGSIDGGLYKMHSKSGMTLWSYQTNSSIQSPPIEHEGVVYFGAEDNNLYAINETNGAFLWNYTTQGSIMGKPVVDGSSIYLTSMDGIVYLLGSPADVYAKNLYYDGMLIEGKSAKLKFDVYNDGLGMANNFDVKVYVDRFNILTQNVTIYPKSSVIVESNWTATHGTHVVEVVINKDNRVPEANTENNQYGTLITAFQDWPKFRRDAMNTGYLNSTDGLNKRTYKQAWSCRIDDNNSWPMYQMHYLWDWYMNSIHTNYTEFNLRLNCTLSAGDFTERRNTIWSCSVTNSTEFPENDFANMKKYLKTYDEATYNQTLKREGHVELPYNITAFSFFWNCSEASSQRAQIENYSVSWYCNPVVGNNEYRPYDHLNAWWCGFGAKSTYKLNDEAALLGYPLHQNSPQIRYPRIGEYRLLWRYKTQGKVKSSPALADIDGDGRMELVVGSDDGMVYCLNSDGRLRWSFPTLRPVRSTPLAADLDKDGLMEITVGSDDSKVYNLNSNGKLNWAFKTYGSVSSSPLSVNLDDTAQEEVVVGSSDGSIYSLTYRGVQDWAYKTRDFVESSPGLVDVDLDGKKEIVVGSNDNNVYVLSYPPYKTWTYQTNDDVAASTPVWRPFYINDVLIVSRDGLAASVFKQSLSDVLIPSKTGPRAVPMSKLTSRWSFDGGSQSFSSPAVADLYSNGSLEVVFTSANNIYVLNEEGVKVDRVTLRRPIYSSPALADLNGDGLVEIVVGSGDGVYIIDRDMAVGWYYPTGFVGSSPSLADINNDGQVEIAVGSDDGWIYVFGATVKRLIDNEMPAPPAGDLAGKNSALTYAGISTPNIPAPPAMSTEPIPGSMSPEIGVLQNTSTTLIPTSADWVGLHYADNRTLAVDSYLENNPIIYGVSLMVALIIFFYLITLRR